MGADDVKLSDSEDARGIASPYERYQVEIPLNGRDSGELWKEFQSSAGNMISKYNYDAMSKEFVGAVPNTESGNSNSVISTVLGRSGYNVTDYGPKIIGGGHSLVIFCDLCGAASSIATRGAG